MVLVTMFPVDFFISGLSNSIYSALVFCKMLKRSDINSMWLAGLGRRKSLKI